MSNSVKHIFGLFLVLTLISCREKPETQEAYIQRALQEKIQKYVTLKDEMCTRELDKKANAIADSILLLEALAVDSLLPKLPTVPEKPEFIEPKPIGDSLAVKPFLDTLDL